MLQFDHIGITVFDLKKAIRFYQKMGYTVLNIYQEDDYQWAVLSLHHQTLELFQSTKETKERFDHIAYQFDEEEEVLSFLKKTMLLPDDVTFDDFEPFLGRLNRKTISIQEGSDFAIQFIKKK